MCTKIPSQRTGEHACFCLYVEAQKAARSVVVALRVVVCRVAGGRTCVVAMALVQRDRTCVAAVALLLLN